MSLGYDGKSVLIIHLIMLLHLCLCAQLGAQSFDSKMREAKQSSSIPQQIENLIALEPDFKYAPKDTLGHLYYFITYRFYQLTDSENSITYAAKTLDNYHLSNYTGYRLPAVHLIKAKAHQTIGQLGEAIKEYDSIIDGPINGRGFESLYEAYWRKAELYRQGGEFESAVYYLNSFIQSSQFDSIGSVGRANLYRELSIAYSGFSGEDKLKLAREALKKADKVYPEYSNVNSDYLQQRVLTEMQKGFLENSKDSFMLAIGHYENSIKLMNGFESEPYFNYLQTIALMNIAECQIEAQLPCHLAKLSIDQADNLFLFHNDPGYLETDIRILAAKAHVYECLEDFKRTKNTYADATYDLIGNTSLNNVNELRNYPHKKWLIEIVLIDEFIYEVAQQNHDQLSNLRTRAYQIDSLIDLHLKDMYFETSMQIAKEEYLEFYQGAIDVAVDLNDHKLYWFLSERSNNLLLLMNVQREEEIGIQNELSSINSNIKKLAKIASQLDNQIFLSDPMKAKIRVDSLKQLLIINKAQQLDLFYKRDAYLNTDITSIGSLNSIISALKTNETVIAYNFSSLRLSAIVINQNGSQLFDMGDKEEIISALRNWHEDASDPKDNIEAMNSFNRLSNELHSLLIKPLGDLLDKITIIPDAELYYLNFETLLRDDDQYLIYDHTITYELSGSLLIKNRKSENTHVSNISAFIPSYTNSDLPELSNTNSGIKALSELSDLHLYSDKETTKDNFIAALKSSEILHFGGHAIKVDENNKYSHLALRSDNQNTRNIISLGDLYSMSSKTQLVALPACHSGSGDLLVGEGISNLSRGFFYAGAKSVISSIWEANDKSNSVIMNSFYENVLKGTSKSTALRQAKLDYLSSAPEFLRHPNLWGGLILTGDNRPLYIKGELSFKYVYAVLGLALFFGIYLLYTQIQKK